MFTHGDHALEADSNNGRIHTTYAIHDPTKIKVSRENIYELDNTAKRCGIMAVLHISYYDI